MGPEKVLREDWLKCVVDERGFSTAAHSGHTDECAERECEVYIAEVVAGGAYEPECLAVAFAAFGGNLYTAGALKVLGRDGVGFHHLGRSALKHHLAPFAPGRGANVNHIVSFKHHVFVMFHNDDRVVAVAQFL